jgi:hypothetical protein
MTMSERQIKGVDAGMCVCGEEGERTMWMCRCVVVADAGRKRKRESERENGRGTPRSGPASQTARESQPAAIQPTTANRKRSPTRRVGRETDELIIVATKYNIQNGNLLFFSSPNSSFCCAHSVIEQLRVTELSFSTAKTFPQSSFSWLFFSSP